jgi:hypothetical protein
VDSLRRIVEKNSVRNWVHNKVVLEIGIAGKSYPGVNCVKGDALQVHIQHLVVVKVWFSLAQQ